MLGGAGQDWRRRRVDGRLDKKEARPRLRLHVGFLVSLCLCVEGFCGRKETHTLCSDGRWVLVWTGTFRNPSSSHYGICSLQRNILSSSHHIDSGVWLMIFIFAGKEKKMPKQVSLLENVPKDVSSRTLNVTFRDWCDICLCRWLFWVTLWASSSLWSMSSVSVSPTMAWEVSWTCSPPCSAHIGSVVLFRHGSRSRESEAFKLGLWDQVWIDVWCGTTHTQSSRQVWRGSLRF